MMKLQERITGSRPMCVMGAVLICAVLTLSSTQVLAGVPMEQLKTSVDKTLSILNDKALKAPAMKEQRRAMLRKIGNEMFDWEEMSKRSLGIYWKDRTLEERKEFVKLFTDLLENTYMDKIESYSGEKILYPNEAVEGQYAVVQTKIVTKQGTEVPVNYWMIGKDGHWFVYDVSVEGVSLIKNYRTQFNEILSRSSYQGLVKKLKEKQVSSQIPAS